MAKLKRLLVSALVEIAQRQRRCSRNREHIIGHGNSCLVIKESMRKRNYCLECANAIVRKAESDLKILVDQIQGESTRRAETL